MSAMTSLETAVGYIRWYFVISHPYILRQQEDVHIPMPPEKEAFDEVAVEEHEDWQWLDFKSRLARVSDHILTIIDSGELEEGSQAWMSLHAILHKAQGGIVNHHSHSMGGRGARA